MPHVSPKKVNKEIMEKIYKLLFSAVSNKYVSKKQQERAFNELLTQTEKIMIGKRLFAVVMLSEGVSPYQVGKTLRLSETTVAKFKVRLNSGKLSNTSKFCKTLKKGHFQQYVENLVKPLPRYGTSPANLFKDK